MTIHFFFIKNWISGTIFIDSVYVYTTQIAKICRDIRFVDDIFYTVNYLWETILLRFISATSSSSLYPSNQCVLG